MRLTSLLSLALAFILFLASCSEEKQSNEQNESNNGRTLNYERTIAFLSNSGDTLTTVDVAIADDDKKRNQGLMDVNNLPKDKGMLFIFDDNKSRSFWMANTPLSLDIMFVNEDYEIVRIHQNAKPFSEKSLASEEPAKYVIETNSGFCISHDIQEGMKVSF
ncbi:MAG: DUF192 domain-containing protein [Bacteroidota bacterium]